MTNNDEGKMNTEDNNSLLKYSTGTSYTHLSDSESQSEDGSASGTAAHPPVQFESRRARRMSETSMMQQVPVAKQASTTKQTVAESETPKPPVVTSLTAPVVSPAPTASSRKDLKEKTKKSLPKEDSPSKEKSKGVTPDPRNSKEYWGGTAIMTSLLVLLVAQVLAAAILIGYILFSGTDFLQEIQGGTSSVEKVMAGTPWLIVISQTLMYVAWLSCLWWVTKYRSAVQRGRDFWVAFKDNFRLNDFKIIDLFWGAGIAAVMMGLQVFVLNVLPMWFPTLNLDEADNTELFRNLDGAWFFILAFGMGGLLGPICEELFFRGFLLRGFSNHFSYKNTGRNMDILEDGLAEQSMGLKSMMVSYRNFTHKYRYVLAAIISSVLFGLIHFQGGAGFAPWLTVIFTGVLGLVFAITTLKLNRLYPAIIGHVLYNSSLFVLMITLNQ